MENYHLFDDMVYWRINGKERTEEERKASRHKIFENACDELLHQDFKVYAALHNGRFIGWISCVYVPKIGYWKKGYIHR